MLNGWFSVSESKRPRWSLRLRVSVLVLVTILVALVTLVLGELVPKRIAMLHAERWSLAAVTPLTWFMNGVRPILFVLEALTDALVRFTGNDLTTERSEITDEEFVTQKAKLLA